jgi:hypothetical protein
MTDNGLAALAEGLGDLFPHYQREKWPFTAEQAAAAILGPHGVFTPDGTVFARGIEKIVAAEHEAREEIATLRAALGEADALIGELAEVVHQTDSLRSHADPNDKTGWNRHGIETCADSYCVDALAWRAALAAAREGSSSGR